jgi:hypothetical protein
MRFLLVLACASLSVAGSLFAQSRPEQVPAGGQVEVKTDRFSGVTTVTLKETGLFKKPDHKLTLSLKVLLDSKSPGNEAVMATFYSYSEAAILFGDLELHCLIDEKPHSLGKAEHGQRGVTHGASNELYSIIDLQDFGYEVQASVEMWKELQKTKDDLQKTMDSLILGTTPPVPAE